MSTVSIERAVPAPARHPQVPFPRLMAVELRKLWDTRAGMWLLGIIAAATAATMIIGLVVMDRGDRTLDNLLGLAAVPQNILLPVLGIMAVTAEWSQRTGLVTFTLEPRRGRVIAAKLVVNVLVSVAALAVSIGLGGLLYAAVGTGGWTLGPGEANDLLVGQLLGILQGVAFGLLFLSTAVAVVAFFALPTVWSVALQIGGDRVASITRWLDLNTTSGPLFGHTMGAAEWAHLAVANTVWVLLPLLLGIWRVMRAEVKSS
ncbi:MAG: ABC transporter permease [Thermoleophilia bacterium]|nr:ABC transporter permease [Thermoleophilia bacterium]